MKVIGITGGVGSGKTALLEYIITVRSFLQMKRRITSRNQDRNAMQSLWSY